MNQLVIFFFLLNLDTICSDYYTNVGYTVHRLLQMENQFLD